LQDSEQQLSKSILIVKASTKSLVTTEAFLGNRGWLIFSTTNLKDALNFLVEHKPPFVMISVDHPQRKVRVLPKILIQAFPVCIIAFVEQTTTASYRLLMDANTEYRVNPPVTGPAVERAISRYVRDQEKIAADIEQAAENDAAQAARLQALNQLKSLRSFGTEEYQNDVEEESHQLTPGPDTDLEQTDLTETHATWKDDENPPKDQNLPKDESLPSDVFTGPSVLGREINNPAAMKDLGLSTLMALKNSANVGDGKVSQPLGTATNVACIIIESTRFSGYLVAALGKNRKLDAAFLGGIKQRLTKFLIESGEVLSQDEQMDIVIKPVDFQNWALEYAEFLRKSVHNGDEVAMAFFPIQKPTAEVGESASTDMASVKLDDLVVNVPLEFNLYMYMPVNQKYVLYTPKGSRLYQEQKSRLEGKGIKDLHMLRAEVQDLSRFKAQNHLNSMIDQFQSSGAKAQKKESA
jgi:hypothetical protein